MCAWRDQQCVAGEASLVQERCFPCVVALVILSRVLIDKHPVLKRDLPKNFGPQSPSAPVLDSMWTKVPENARGKAGGFCRLKREGREKMSECGFPPRRSSDGSGSCPCLEFSVYGRVSYDVCVQFSCES